MFTKESYHDNFLITCLYWIFQILLKFHLKKHAYSTLVARKQFFFWYRLQGIQKEEITLSLSQSIYRGIVQLN